MDSFAVTHLPEIFLPMGTLLEYVLEFVTMEIFVSIL